MKNKKKTKTQKIKKIIIKKIKKMAKVTRIKGKEKKRQIEIESKEEEKLEKEKKDLPFVNKCHILTNPFIIVIGIENYNQNKSNFHWQNLFGVKQDVLQMSHLFYNIYNYQSISISYNINDKTDAKDIQSFNIKILKYKKNCVLEKECDIILDNKQKFHDYLIKMRSKIDLNEKNDGLIIFYSGHGVKDNIILGNGDRYKISNIISIFMEKIALI